MKLRIAGTVNDSIVDGPGIRFTIFTQGCFHNCPGCHNPQTHDVSGGYEIEVSELLKKIDENPLLSGITLSGGEPFLQVPGCLELVKEVKKRGLNIISYTGYLYEDILENPEMKPLLVECDYLIDGPFIIGNRDLELNYRGSSNQRIIDVKQSLQSLKVVTVEL